MARKKPIDARSAVWTLFQTMTVRDIAKKLGKDRRTIQRWKNQGQKPLPKNAAQLETETKRREKEYRRMARTKREHIPLKKNIPVTLPFSRGYTGQEVNKEQYEELKRRAKIEPRRKFDRFQTQKDKRKKIHYFWYQPSNTFQFDIRKATLEDIARTMLAYQGEGRQFSIAYVVTKPYRASGGVEVKKGTRSALAYARLDEFPDENALLQFLNKNSAGRRFLTLRLTDA